MTSDYHEVDDFKHSSYIFLYACPSSSMSDSDPNRSGGKGSCSIRFASLPTCYGNEATTLHGAEGKHARGCRALTEMLGPHRCRPSNAVPNSYSFRSSSRS